MPSITAALFIVVAIITGCRAASVGPREDAFFDSVDTGADGVSDREIDVKGPSQQILRDLVEILRSLVTSLAKQVRGLVPSIPSGAGSTGNHDLVSIPNGGGCVDCDTLAGFNPIPDLIKEVQKLFVELERSVQSLG